MPKQVGKSALAARLGPKAKQAYYEHRNDEVTYSGAGELPEGIEGGVAQLVDCKFSQYQKGDMKGKDFFYAAGVVKEPKIHNGIPIEGLRTSIMEPLCDTPSRKSRPTVGDHIAWTINELQKLGIVTGDIEFEDLESTAAALKESKPHFRFRTWKGDATEQYPNPRVNHEWRGACEYNGELTDAVEDATGEAEETEAQESAATDDLDALAESAEAGEEEAINSLSGQARLFGISDKQVAEAESWAAVVELIREAEAEGSKPKGKKPSAKPAAPDYGSLGAAADEGDEDAIASLQGSAEEAGIDPDEYETWADLAAALEGGGDKSEAEAEDWKPDKGDVYYYRPPKAKKSIEVEVTAVFEGKKTCNLKNLDDGKSSYKSVPWSALSQER